MIKTIETHGLKTRHSRAELGRLTLIRGRVGAGKTAIADAIQYVALGCVPRVGRSDAATRTLMRGPAIYASVTLEDGRTFERSLELSLYRGKEKLTGGATASWMPIGSKPTETAEAIRSLFGDSDDEAGENLDVMRLLAVSGAELAKRIEKILGAGGMTVEQRVTKAMDLWRERIDSVCRNSVDGIRQPLHPSIKAAMDAAEAAIADHVRADVVAAIAWCGEQKRKASGDAKEAIQARTAMEAELRMRGVTESEADLSARRAALVEASTKATRDIEIWQRSEADRTATAEAIERATAMVTSAMEALERARNDAAQRVPMLRLEIEGIVDPAEVPVPVLEEMPAEAAQLKAETDAIVDPDPVPVAEMVAYTTPEECLALDREANELDAEARKIDATLPPSVYANAEIAAVQVAESALSLAEKSPWREVEKIAATIEDMGPSLAEECGRLRELASQHGGNLDEYKANVTKVQEARDAALEAVEAREQEREGLTERASDLRGQAAAKRLESTEKAAAKKREVDAENTKRRGDRDELVRLHGEALGKARVRRAELRGKALLLEQEVSTRNTTAKRDYEKAVADRREVVDSNRRTREQLTADIERLEKAVTTAEATKAEADRSLTAAQERLAGLQAAHTVDIEASRKTIDDNRREVLTIDDKLKAVRDAAALERKLREMIARVEGLDAESRVYGEAEWSIKRIRDEDMNARRGGLEARMRRFLEAAGREESPYLRAEKGACEFGWRTREGDEVECSALSGGQAVLFRAALAYAIVATRAPEIRVLLVELAEAGDGQVDAAILKACETVSDEVQVIVATCVPTIAPENWTVIEVVPEVAPATNEVPAAEEALR